MLFRSCGLELELTEGMLMADTEHGIELLDSLANLGVSLSVDDFGTGYSSLRYLKRFPLDTLKVDRTFLRDLPENASDTAIVNAIITLAHSLNLRAVAEGVETLEQLEMLEELACDEVQGYFFSKPLPAAELESWDNARRARRGHDLAASI